MSITFTGDIGKFSRTYFYLPVTQLTFSESYGRVFSVNSVQNSFIADLGLGDEANLAADVRRPSAHVCPLMSRTHLLWWNMRPVKQETRCFAFQGDVMRLHNINCWATLWSTFARPVISIHDMAVFIFLLQREGRWEKRLRFLFVFQDYNWLICENILVLFIQNECSHIRLILLLSSKWGIEENIVFIRMYKKDLKYSIFVILSRYCTTYTYPHSVYVWGEYVCGNVQYYKFTSLYFNKLASKTITRENIIIFRHGNCTIETYKTTNAKNINRMKNV